MLSYLNPLPSLPAYTGPHAVGSTEYEIPISSLSLPALPEAQASKLRTLKFRLFYPTSPKTASDSSSQGYGIPWLQEPQRAHLNAYLRLSGMKPWLSDFILSSPFRYYLSTTQIPAYHNAPLLCDGAKIPTLIFSHGLVGNMNTHSALLGELASYGVVCLALDHRDGSGPLTTLRKTASEASGGDAATVPSEVGLANPPNVYYKPITLKIKPGMHEARDEQLSIRLFELSAAYQALEMMNDGHSFQNLAAEGGHPGKSGLTLPKGALDMAPGNVIWAGHSFGGTSTVQFVKSVYYFGRNGDDARSPLLWQDPSSTLKAQVTPHSPVVLLDPWFLPLRSPMTEMLLRKPLPCHDASAENGKNAARTVVLMCSEFAYHWPECHAHMPVVAGPNPSGVKVQTIEEYREEFARYKGPRDYMNKSKEQRANYLARAESEKESDKARRNSSQDSEEHVSMYVLHDTTHVTHCDFGIMFPWMVWWFTGQRKPVLATRNIARCILAETGVDSTMQMRGDATVEKVRLEQVSKLWT
ncbi:hypothetical protein PV08_08784 [Exophiala spinifera]|uniref:1-alkyl-2-acetylglycerophosphocholine esterase n=1 Tax=Exophiala spinifera TaxID=91928 RepID=A0A0D2B4I9_9EURO|nr:uncharacterized protein PV08_08784 [Exophiala spinifera]KIW13595.1 hypothetical protein PV08_08784 [Exophiala spinifera]